MYFYQLELMFDSNESWCKSLLQIEDNLVSFPEISHV